MTEAQIKWKNNWVTFIDGIIQLHILRRKHNTVSKPNFIRKLSIDVNEKSASEMCTTKDEVTLINAHILSDDSIKYVICHSYLLS